MAANEIGRRTYVRTVGAGLVGASGLSTDAIAAQAEGATVYFGSDDWTIYAVDAASGDEVWQYDAEGEIRSAPTVVDGTVFVGSNDTTLYALDATDGSLEWTFEGATGAIRSDPTVVDGTVYVGSDDGTLYAVDAETGTQEWAFTSPINSLRGAPAYSGGTVYVGSDDASVYAVADEDGTSEWTFDAPEGGVRGSVTVRDGAVYAPTYGPSSDLSRLYSIDAESGSQNWQFEFEMSSTRNDRVLTGVLLVGSAAYVGYSTQNFVGVDVTNQSQTLSIFGPSGSDSFVATTPTFSNRRLLWGFSERDNNDASIQFRAYNLATDSEDWQFDGPSANIRGSPTADGDAVYFGDDDGTLYSVDVTRGNELWSFQTPSNAVRSAPTYVRDPSGHSVGSRVIRGTMGHHFWWPGESTPGAPELFDYTDRNLVVRLEGLTDAVQDWSRGLIDTDLLMDVLEAYQNGRPIA